MPDFPDSIGSFANYRPDRMSALREKRPSSPSRLLTHLRHGQVQPTSWQCPLMTVPSRLCALSVPSTRLMKPCQTAVGSNRCFQMLPSVSAVSKNKCVSVTWTAKLLPRVHRPLVQINGDLFPIYVDRVALAARKAPRPAFQIDRLGMCSRCS